MKRLFEKFLGTQSAAAFTIAFVGLVVAVLGYVHNRRAYTRDHNESSNLTVIPAQFRGAFDEKGWSYTATVTFINRGNTELLLSEFALYLFAPARDGEGRAVGEGGSWHQPVVVLRPKEAQTVTHEFDRPWGGPLRNYPESTLESDGKFEFSYYVQDARGTVRRGRIPIAARFTPGAHVFGISEPQRATSEAFDPKTKLPSAPKLRVVEPEASPSPLKRGVVPAR